MGTQQFRLHGDRGTGVRLPAITPRDGNFFPGTTNFHGTAECRRRSTRARYRGVSVAPSAHVPQVATCPQDHAPAVPAAPVVAFYCVALGFDDNVVLRDVSFTVSAGSLKVLLGPSGSGKSVILKLILGRLLALALLHHLFGGEV